MKDPLHVGVFRFQPADITKDRGHEYGVGRKAEVHTDRRTKRRKTRATQRREWMKGG